jgi:hypothetical protein
VLEVVDDETVTDARTKRSSRRAFRLGSSADGLPVSLARIEPPRARATA